MVNFMYIFTKIKKKNLHRNIYNSFIQNNLKLGTTQMSFRRRMFQLRDSHPTGLPLNHKKEPQVPASVESQGHHKSIIDLCCAVSFT